MKIVGSCYYTHFSNIGLFILQMADKYPNFSHDFTEACNIYNAIHPENHKVVVIKYDHKANSFSFIDCPTFDFLNEPIVGDSYRINLNDGSWKLIRGGTKVYHHKWMFVHSH